MATEPISLAKPLSIRAEMARLGLAPAQMTTYEDPERGWLDPLDDDEMRTAVRRLMSALWAASLRHEGADRG